ncbi:MAG TPA: hypothetical protein PLN95_03460 [Candidatus Saccharibacteria bacterium]|nr:hypothetical protein [Candidatus Saccharibacteria bacterium]
MDPFSRQDSQNVPSEPTQPALDNEPEAPFNPLGQGVSPAPTSSADSVVKSDETSPPVSAPATLRATDVPDPTHTPFTTTPAPSSPSHTTTPAPFEPMRTPPPDAIGLGPTPSSVSGSDSTPETPFNPFGAAPAPNGSPATVADGSVMPPAPDAPTGGKKKKLIAIIVGVGVTLLLGGSVAAYTVINNTPEKILQDAFFNTVKKEEGSYKATVEGSEDTGKITLAGGWTKDMASADVNLDVPASAVTSELHLSAHVVTTSDKFYLKADGIKEIASGYLGGETSPYDNLITKIDGKWIVITESDLEEYFGIEKDADDEKRAQCLETVMTNFQSDKNQQREVYDTYKKNTFIVVTKQKDEVIDSRNAYHLSVTFDDAKAKSFAKALESTSVYKAAHECVKEDVGDASAEDIVEDIDEETADASEQPSIDLWVDKSSRTLRKIQVKSNESEPKDSRVTAQVTFDFTKAVKIAEPEATVTIQDLKTEIEKLQQQLYPGYSDSFEYDDDMPQELGVSTQRIQLLDALRDTFRF